MKKLMLLFLLFPLMANGQIVYELEETGAPECHYPDFKAAGKGTPLAPTQGADADFSYQLITRDSTVARAVVTQVYSDHKKELVVPDYVAMKKTEFSRERDDWGYPIVYQWAVDSIDRLVGDGIYEFEPQYDDVVSLKLPETIRGIHALYGFRGLQSFHLPASVKVIRFEEGFLQGCPSLTSLSVGEGNTVFDSRDNCNAIIETATNTLRKGCSTTQIPATVEVIGEDAFAGCPMSSIEIPSGVKVISGNAFRDCKNLSHIEIPASVAKIGGQAFDGCENLSEVTLSEGLDSIFNYAFNGSNLKELVLPKGVEFVDILAFDSRSSYGMKITCLDTTPPKTVEGDYYQSHTDELYAINKRNVLYVPVGCKEVYQNAPGWRTYGIILEIGEPLPTGIASPKSVNGATSSYSLSGHRLSAPLMQKGIYIVNGKKVLMK